MESDLCLTMPCIKFFNTFPNNRTLDETKFKVFADNKLNFANMTISLFDRVENTVGKGENTGYQHFLLFSQCFPKSSSLGSLKVGINCVVKSKPAVGRWVNQLNTFPND